MVRRKTSEINPASARTVEGAAMFELFVGHESVSVVIVLTNDLVELVMTNLMCGEVIVKRTCKGFDEVVSGPHVIQSL